MTNAKQIFMYYLAVVDVLFINSKNQMPYRFIFFLYFLLSLTFIMCLFLFNLMCYVSLIKDIIFIYLG